MRCSVSAKGQVTIPKEIRDELGLYPGVLLDFHAEKGRLIAKKVSVADTDPVEEVTGILPRSQDIDEFLDEIRGEP